MSERLVIGFCGKKRSGKDLAAAVVQVIEPSFRVFAFGDALKRECAEMLNIHVDDIEKDKELYRPFLQWYGTDFKRRTNSNYWIDELSRTLDANSSVNIAISDVRFENEIEWVRQIGGSVIYIDRDYQEDENSRHASEQVDSIANLCDQRIVNSGTPEFISEVAEAYHRLSGLTSLSQEEACTQESGTDPR